MQSLPEPALQLLLPALLAAAWALHAHRLYRRLHQVRRDPVTGLLTRDGWSREARRVLERNARPVVLLADLDAFKPVNDCYGHAAGDAVLAAAGRRLSDWCGQRGVAGRLGGDEFVAVLADDEDLEERFADLAGRLREPVEHEGHVLTVGASIGSVRRDELPGPDLSAALAAADAAMYRTKGRSRRGRNTPAPAPAPAPAPVQQPLRPALPSAPLSRMAA
ncbi:GGDEF domain-containing protein [Streptomyces sp. ODS28]|uniref:GGDEF domain-containing protein n=1 Tax=Streptomyces sp. ODS28 TaxID=3136688 RepID=UPI0031EED88B